MRFLFVIATIFNLSIQAQTVDSLAIRANSLACIDISTSDSLANLVISNTSASHYAMGMAYQAVGKNAFCFSDFGKAIPNFKKAIAHFEDGDYLIDAGKALNNLANAYKATSKDDSSKIIIQKFLQVADQTQDTILLLFSTKAMAGYYLQKSRNDSAIYYSQQLLDMAQRFTNKQHENIANEMIGAAYYGDEEFKLAIKYSLMAERGYEEMADSVNLSRIYYNLATDYTKLDSVDKAIIYYWKAMKSPSWRDNKYYLAYGYQGLGHANELKGNLSKAIEYNLKSAALSEEVGESRSLTTVLVNLSGCYVKQGQYRKAVKTAERAIALAEEIEFDEKAADGYYFLSMANEKLGNATSALRDFKAFYSLDSTILNRERKRAIAEMETRYETEKKDNEIASLSQQASIQALEIRQKNQAIVIGIIAILLVLGVIYFLYKQRESKRQHSQTELEQRFLRSQLNPHFISNALVAVQSFMLKNDTESASLYLTKFSKLMREILENSRREFIPVEEEINMLKNYMDIHQQRLGSFEYSIELDEAIDPEVDTIPPMFVQPFVENAVEHGIGNMQSGGKIELKFQKQGDFITIAVNDNGKGLAQRADTDHKSFSTTIIQERMDLFNLTLKRKIQLVIDNLKNENGEVSGTRVELKVPFGI